MFFRFLRCLLQADMNIFFSFCAKFCTRHVICVVWKCDLQRAALKWKQKLVDRVCMRVAAAQICGQETGL